MPIQLDRSESLPLSVYPSAAFELMWVLHNAEADHVLKGSFASLEPIREKHRAALSSFWGDGVRGFTEMVVLASRTRSLAALDLNHFFAGVEEAAILDVPIPTLMSESPAERIAIGKRLETLRSDAKVRARYIGTIHEIWESVCGEWERVGVRAALAGAAEWKKELDAGKPFRELLGRNRIWPGRPDLDEMADAKAAEGNLVLSPGWFFGDIHVVELDGLMYLGRGVQPRDEDDDRFHVAKFVSASLKAFADPTRLAILMWVAREPASVTEIARHFKLAQPTVSAHVQVLREAGVLEERAVGRSAKLSVSEQSMRRVFGEAEEALALQMRHQRSQR